MSSNKEKILTTFEELKGQFVITTSHHIERLVAIGDDGDDYYWVTFNGRELVWNTCVGRIMPLKGYLRDEDYLELIRLAKLNHSAIAFLVFVQQKNQTLSHLISKKIDMFIISIFFDMTSLFIHVEKILSPFD